MVDHYKIVEDNWRNFGGSIVPELAVYFKVFVLKLIGSNQNYKNSILVKMAVIETSLSSEIDKGNLW